MAARSRRLAGIGDDVVDLQPSGEDRLRPALDGHHLRLPPVGEERLHGLAEDDLRPAAAEAVRRSEARPVQDRVEDPPRADRRVAHARRDARPDEQEGDVHRGLVEEVPVLGLAVVAEPLAVVADDHDRDAAPLTCCSNARTRRPSCSSIAATSPRYGRLRVAAAERLGRGVGSVRVEVVDPEKQRLRSSPRRRYASARSVVSRAVRSARPAGSSSS